jgi:hypothetical protein
LSCYLFDKELGAETIEVEAKTYQHAMRILRSQFGEDAEEFEFVGYGEEADSF